MHELSQIPPLNVNVRQIRSRLEPDQSVTVSVKEHSSCSNIIKQRKIFYEGARNVREQNVSQMKQKPVVPRKPCKSPTTMLSPVSPINALNVDISEDDLSPMNTTRSSSGSRTTRTTPSSSSITSDRPDTPRHATKVRSAAAFYDVLIQSGQMTSPTPFVRSPNDSSFDRSSSMRSSEMSDGSWTDYQVKSPPSSEAESLSSAEQFFDCSNEDAAVSNGKTLVPQVSAESDETQAATGKASIFGQQSLHATAMEELKRNNVFRGTGERTSTDTAVYVSETGADFKGGKLRPKSGKQNREVNSNPLPGGDFEATSLRPRSDAYGRMNLFCRGTATCAAAFSFNGSFTDYNTGCPEEDKRLKKLHYAALEIFTVEKKFVEQLELLAVKYPAFLENHGKECGIDLLKQPGEQPHLISQISFLLKMVEEAHKILLEKFSSKIDNWDSRHPNMAGCLKRSAGVLKFCLPYLRDKKKYVEDLIRLLQDNEELARATAKFEEQVMGKISVIQQLDIVHQNVVRYPILLEAYQKYLLPGSRELKECREALAELSKVSESVNRQISLAEMEKRSVDLYRRLEGRFNVFEANRRLLFEGELRKQSRKDLQPRYLILFSDVLLICKYSRTPSLGADANFHSDFYKFPVSRIRVKAEEHGEYETHFLLYTTQKSAVFVAKTKRERDDWVKRITEAKMEAKELRHSKALRHKKLNIRVLHRELPVTETTSDAITTKIAFDGNISPNYVHIREKYTPVWIPDPKATSCMMAGCSTKFNVLNRRHHCRECGYLICRSCVGYAPVKTGSEYVRSKVCPECYVKISKKYSAEFGEAFFTAPENESFTKTCVPSRNAEGVVSGTVFLRNQKGGESEKWGRLTSHADGALVLGFYDAEFDADPVLCYVLLGFTLSAQELDDGGRLFELRHANQVNDRNAISVHFRIAHSGNAERWYKVLNEGLEIGGKKA